MNRYIYPAVFTFNDYSIQVCFPDLGEQIKIATNIDDAYDKACDMLGTYIHKAVIGKVQLANATTITNIKLKSENEKIVFIAVDMDKWFARYDQSYVRKNITLPKWLYERTKELGINVSGVLQNALIEYIAKSEKK